MSDLNEHLEDLYNAELFLKQENQIYYNIEMHSSKGYSQTVSVRSDFLKEALKSQIEYATYLIAKKKEYEKVTK